MKHHCTFHSLKIPYKLYPRLYSVNPRENLRMNYDHLNWRYEQVVLENIALKHQLNYVRNELEERNKQIDRPLGHVEAEMKGKLPLMKHMMGEDDGSSSTIEDLRNNLKDKIEETGNLECLNHDLIFEERVIHNELLEARKEIIDVLSDMPTDRSYIGVKRMGELDHTPFMDYCMKKYPGDEAKIKFAELIQKWEDQAAAIVDGMEQLVTVDDGPLTELKNECGEAAYNSVIKAFKEILEYNSGGRFPVLELWNFKENRKATLKESISSVFKKLRK